MKCPVYIYIYIYILLEVNGDIMNYFKPLKPKIHLKLETALTAQ